MELSYIVYLLTTQQIGENPIYCVVFLLFNTKLKKLMKAVNKTHLILRYII